MRSLLNRISLRWKIALLISVVTTLFVALSALILYGYEAVSMKDLLLRDFTASAQLTATSLSGPVAFRDLKDAEEVLTALRLRGSIERAVVFDKTGTRFAQFRRSDIADTPVEIPSFPSGIRNNAIHVVEPITQAGDQIGTLYVVADLKYLDERLAQYVTIMGVLIMSAAALSFLFAAVLQSTVSRPILGLSATAQEVARTKDYSLRAPVTSEDEIGQLIRQFNAMLEQIQLQNQALQAAQNELERKVEARTAELTLANRELESFAYSVSHDLRAPLRHISGFVALLEQDLPEDLDSTTLEHLKDIRASVEGADQLIRDLLEFSRTSRAEIQVLRFNMGELVQEVVRDAKRETVGRNIEWVLHPLPDVACDVSLLRQVWRNLVSNAVKYTRPRTNARIEIGSETKEGQSVFFIRDNGIGFNMQYANKLFGVFQRLHGSEFEGTGIGLANVRNVISRHGGKTWGVGAINEGATFYFTLPEQPQPSPGQS